MKLLRNKKYLKWKSLRRNIWSNTEKKTIRIWDVIFRTRRGGHNFPEKVTENPHKIPTNNAFKSSSALFLFLKMEKHKSIYAIIIFTKSKQSKNKLKIKIPFSLWRVITSWFSESEETKKIKMKMKNGMWDSETIDPIFLE